MQFARRFRPAMFNIYDGPAFQEDNAYLDFTTTISIKDCRLRATGGNCAPANGCRPQARNTQSSFLKDWSADPAICRMLRSAGSSRMASTIRRFHSKKLWFRQCPTFGTLWSNRSSYSIRMIPTTHLYKARARLLIATVPITPPIALNAELLSMALITSIARPC